MKSPRDFTGVFIHREPIDMRKGINGLSEIVQFAMQGDLKGANLFVFTGKRRHSIKILYFDRSGFCLWQKRLEQDKLPWPKKICESVVKISPQQLEWLLDGYDVWKMKSFNEVNFERVY